MLTAMNNLIEMFEYQANQRPNDLFCVDTSGKYTYQDAKKVIERVASSLIKKEIKNEPILIFSERNSITLFTMLAILMSNNYFIPVNPEYSEEKVQAILSSSQVHYQIRLNETSKISSLNSFLFDDLANDNLDENVLKQVREEYKIDSPIYAIYTSGSTGKPKGVLKTHKNMMAFVNNFQETFALEDGLHIASQAPLFFDASMKDVFLTLKTGATLYFPDKSLFAMPLGLVDYLNENQIQYICWVPSALTIMARLKVFKYALPQYLKYVMFVGEVFMPKYFNYWFTYLPHIQYVNLYGSTELAGVCLYKRIESLLDESKPIPLGVPLKNNQVFLDEEGEITVISDQIAAGYINDEAKNKEVFIKKDNQVVLKTGDFAYQNEEGDIVFMSRKDYQIKHMGYRIELQEIDVAVSSLKYIDLCATLYQKETDKIVVFVSLNQSVENINKTLLNDLKEIVPAYMLPSRIQVLDALPLNPNGKIDRVKLKEMLGE